MFYVFLVEEKRVPEKPINFAEFLPFFMPEPVSHLPVNESIPVGTQLLDFEGKIKYFWLQKVDFFQHFQALMAWKVVHSWNHDISWQNYIKPCCGQLTLISFITQKVSF